MEPKKVTSPHRQSWSAVNKKRKLEKKEWKEKSLQKKKKLSEQKDQTETIKENEQFSDCQNSTPSNKISTLSIAVPGSILENAQSAELRTYLGGQIARMACLFQVDEIVIYDDYGDEPNTKKSTLEDNYGLTTMRHSCVQFARILQYLECPQYLRKTFFPIHSDLKFTGLLNPLNAPHHLSINDNFIFREGVVTNKPVKPGKGSVVNIGLRQEVHVDRLLTPGLRCTVRLHLEKLNSKKLKGVVVSPEVPRKETGVYWGYNVRLAKTLSQVFTQCPYKSGYDLSIGTSDKGSSIDEFSCPSYNHLLIMFGGVQGLEFALENDTLFNDNDPRLLFDEYLNTLPHQGSKTIRTEEAILITLSGLRSKLNPLYPPMIFNETDITVNVNDTSSSNKGNDIATDDLSRFD